MVSQLNLREIDAFSLPPELQQANQTLEEDRSFLKVCIAVIEYLRQERVGPYLQKQGRGVGKKSPDGH